MNKMKTQLLIAIFCFMSYDQNFGQTITVTQNGMTLYPSYQNNGVIKLGRDSAAGGSIVWLSESNGNNMVNNWDLGRQIQMNTRDLNGDYNPTQAGDGPNASGSIIFFADTNITFSKSQPLLFYNLPPYSGPPRPAYGELFYMWTEFLPNSNNRGFLIKTFFQNKDTLQGECFTNVVSPGDILNHTPFSGLQIYDGKYPWTGGALSTIIDPWDGMNATRFSSTERWFALTDNSNYGISHLGDFSYGDVLFFNTPGMECKSVNANERFALRTEPNDTMQVREGWGIYYVGPVTDARNFFSSYKPQLSGSFSDNFSDNRLLNWYRNNNPIQVQGGALKMGPDNSWVNDISLINKTYADASFSVDIKHQFGTSWYGIAIRKTGMGHFWEVGSGYYLIYLTATGNLVLYSPNGGTLAATTIPGYIAANWNNLNVQIVGYTILVKVNGTTYIYHTDASQSFSSGSVSLVNDGNIVWFDNFSVTAQGDSVAPSNVTNEVIAYYGDTIQLNWTNPTNSDWRWTRIMKKQNVYSNHWRDGFPVYEGKLNSYKDLDVQSGATYCYTIYTCDHAGNYSSGINLPCTSLGTDDPLSLQTNFTFSIFPNPSNGLSNLRIKSNIARNLRLTIYDNLGGKAKVLDNLFCKEGITEIPVDLTDLPTAFYFFTLSDTKTFSVAKMILIK